VTRVPNVAASVMARLLARAKARGEDYQLLVTAYALERLLFRLGQSAVRERFVLKGALLLRLWSDQPYRATRDLDLLRRGDGSVDAIHDDFVAILETPVPEDGIEFDVASLQLEPIRAESAYVGSRVTLDARCGKHRIPLQVDLGVGDAAWPTPQVQRYPALLDAPSPEVYAYARETVVAEKLEAIVVLGDRNSRIKDYFDLHVLAMQHEFERAELCEAVQRTFERRQTPIPEEAPIGLTPEFWLNPSRPAQVRAFAGRTGVDVSGVTTDDLNRVLVSFLLPIIADARSRARPTGRWAPGGPWR
jgi:predicted nucleotidyltransferase component of viral defense system